MRLPASALFLIAACTTDAARAPGGDTTSASVPAPAAAPGRGGWVIGIGGDTGAVHAGTTRAALEDRYGGALADTLVHVGEGQFEPGTVIHPADPVRRAAIIWQDSARSRPWRVQVTGDSTRWSVGPGITLGTTLAELEQLNGGPFRLTGFGWDYGGTVMGWSGGTLEATLLGGNGRVLLRLAPRGDPPADALRAASGDGVFESDAPEMRRLDPAVHQIIVEYDEQ